MPFHRDARRASFLRNVTILCELPLSCERKGSMGRRRGLHSSAQLFGGVWRRQTPAVMELRNRHTCVRGLEKLAKALEHVREAID